MINCPNCTHFDGHDCAMFGRQPGMAICPYAEERKPRNHFEEIKSMSMEELAVYLEETVTRNPHCKPEKDCTNDDSCIPCWLDWLKEEIADA